MSDVPIALQLWSVREQCAQDLPGTLKAVAEMGYQGVEFAGYYDRSAAELRDMLDEVGLQVAGSHLRIDNFLDDALERTIAFERTLGNNYLVVPVLGQDYTRSPEAWHDTARLFNRISEKLRAHGQVLGFHNHRGEFEPIDGQVPWDIFAQNTDNDVLLQLDVGHCVRAGGDPLACLQRYPGRSLTVHVREYAPDDPNAPVGQGAVPWQQVFGLCEDVGGTRWYIVEHTPPDRPPLQAVEHCLENLRRMGK